MIAPLLQSLRWYSKTPASLFPPNHTSEALDPDWANRKLSEMSQMKHIFCCLLSPVPLLSYFHHYCSQLSISLGQWSWLTPYRNLTHPVLRALAHHWLYLLQMKGSHREKDQLETVEIPLLSQPGCWDPVSTLTLSVHCPVKTVCPLLKECSKPPILLVRFPKDLWYLLATHLSRYHY